ncbi:bifunctional adenosylcobinamide kinase/adenosylcobinamide-phosphate guanylyltransferase, partial [Selenomonas noxia]
AGIVPEHRLGRLYRDMAGLANQQIASHAEEVYLVTCGIPVNIKKLAEDI